ncbi:hypothetical protein ASD04_17790 [Devosia sp. Root436]|uniref:transposase n=1 Tax=Devosia sp. Root436 TaxID=1736537 RepID=UPI0006F809A3|nr:transposase [Devosia sp. Root436]KQX34093.1 hypothetical protein ASD04_17790 [Devosia sp. Root436]
MTEGDGRELAWLLHYVQPLAELDSGHKRKAAIMELHGREVHDWRGKLVRLKRTTLYGYVKDYLEFGAAGLLRKKRADTGKKKVHVSRKWDNAVPFDDATKIAMSKALQLRIRGLWMDNQERSKVRSLAESYLQEQTAKLGYVPIGEAIFALSIDRIDQERVFLKAGRHRLDRKASEDSRWRQPRTTENLVPMEVVVGDVHYMNDPITMPTGRVVWPRMISFVDVATQRIFSVVVISEMGGSVRVIDMIQAYKAMVTDPSWGIPRTLYLDNGKENGFAPFMQDAARLAWEEPDGSSMRTLIFAQAYNAQAKAHVEARFAYVENHFYKHMEGWAGDNRHDPKVPALGKRHEPWSKGVEAFFEDFYGYERVDNTFKRDSGGIAGRSPEQRFQEFVDAGWAAVVAGEQGFNMAFSERKQVKLTRQQFRLENRFWSCDALKKYHGDYAMIYRPKYHKFNALVVEDTAGNFLGIAEPNEIVDYLDPKGIINSLAARKLYYEGLRELERQAPIVDGGKLLIERARKQPLARPNPPRGTVNVSLYAEPLLAITPRKATLADQVDQQEIARRAKEAEFEASLARQTETLRRLRSS